MSAPQVGSGEREWPQGPPAAGRLRAGALALVALLLPPALQAAPHPLDPLGAAEIHAAVRLLAAAGHFDDETFLPRLALEEPEKPRVLAWSPGDPVPRRARAVLLRRGRTREAVIDLVAGRIESVVEVPGVQPGILLTEETGAADRIVRSDPGWRAAVARRGIDDLDEVVLVPLTAGDLGAEERRLKVVAFDGRGVENFWGRPIEGLVAVVSLDRGSVVELLDAGVVPIPRGRVDFGRETLPPPRPEPGRIEVAQPEGPGFRLDGHRVEWWRWSFHWRIDPRVGPVVSLVAWGHGEARRPVLYQASLSEMLVPYTDPDAGWAFRAYLDAGEYGLGKLASRLAAGRDCPSHATLLDAGFADDWGNPYLQPHAACLFERSTGELAWRHFEALTGATESRPATELVLRSIPAVGNYDYVVDWVFRQDGSIAVSVGATGVPQVKGVASRDATSAGAARDAAWGRHVAEHAVAVHHDHFFSFRLDLDVDGRDNSLLVERLEPVALEGEGPLRSSWRIAPRIAATESEARLRIDLERPALWRVVNPKKPGPLGEPVSYQLVPGANAVPLFAAGDLPRRRAGFVDHHLWVTPYRPGERHAAGDYPNQSAGGQGLPRWSAADRPIEGTDLVLWYTLGMHHVVRPEDWPVQPTVRRGFELRPVGFFPRNPALGVPE